LFGFFLPIAGICLLIFLLNQLQYGVDRSVSESASDSEDEHYTADKDSKNVNEFNHRLVADAIHAYRQNRKAQEAERAKREHINIKVLVFTAIFAFLAAGAAIYSGWVFSRQLDEMTDSEIRELRAYVFVQRMNFSSHLNPIANYIWWSIVPIWENSGSTFTKHLITNINWSFRDDDLPNDFGYPPNDLGYGTTALIGPRSSIRGAEVTFTGADLIPVQNGTKRLFIWGFAQYNDVFEKTAQRKTLFCYRLYPIRGDVTRRIGDDNIVEITFNNCLRHNCADEDCAGQ
jgi:hypothetical protein